MSRKVRFFAIALLYAGCAWSQRTAHFLPEDPSAFVAEFASPPADNSPQTRAELDELLEIQTARTPAEREAARADRRKEVRQFYGALGLRTDAGDSLIALRDFMERIESDVSMYVRAAKHHFARARPYAVEARLEPCVGDVADSESYPSGHSTYGYVVALVLADMVPERRKELLARADEFAHHRMTCGVHYASDIAAGRAGAKWLVREMRKGAGYRAASHKATVALRSALELPADPPR